MHAVGVFSTADQGSILADIDLPLTTRRPSPSGETVWGGALGAETVVIVHGEENGLTDWHNAAGPLISIVIGGAWEIEATNGDKRILEIGSMLLVCDKFGKGHRSRIIGPTCTVVGVRLTDLACAELKAHCQPDLPATIVWPC